MNKTILTHDRLQRAKPAYTTRLVPAAKMLTLVANRTPAQGTFCWRE
jgi:hypothetical protein